MTSDSIIQPGLVEKRNLDCAMRSVVGSIVLGISVPIWMDWVGGQTGDFGGGLWYGLFGFFALAACSKYLKLKRQRGFWMIGDEEPLGPFAVGFR